MYDICKRRCLNIYTFILYIYIYIFFLGLHVSRMRKTALDRCDLKKRCLCRHLFGR